MALRSNRLLVGFVVSALMLALGGLAFAQEIEPADFGDAPFVLFAEEVDGWLPGDGKPPWAGGPPPWAGKLGDPDGNDDGGPRWLREDMIDEDWEPGTTGPPPWSNARWLREDVDPEEWAPGTGGPPPWAGRNGNGNGNGG
jgi:hypothetical protein